MTTTTTIRPCGDAALLLECADLAAAVGCAEQITKARLGAVDVVAAARTVLVTAREPGDLPRLRRAVAALLEHIQSQARAQAQSPAAGGAAAERGQARVVTLDVRYDGPDLADVAELAGVSVEEFVRRHTAVTWKAAFGGFAPGFFYLVDARELEGTGGAEVGAAPEAGAAAGADRMPTVPRLGSPRPKVPAGSVAMADRFCAVYPGASPGGWRLLGTTDAQLWDTDRERPALLEPGVIVRFRGIGAGGGADAAGGSGDGSGSGGVGELGGAGGVT